MYAVSRAPSPAGSLDDGVYEVVLAGMYVVQAADRVDDGFQPLCADEQENAEGGRCDNMLLGRFPAVII
eukprot:746317-Hanusia_phi.AAC.3